MALMPDQAARLVEDRAWELLERPRRVLISEVCPLVPAVLLRAVRAAGLSHRAEHLVVVDDPGERDWWASRLPAGVRYVTPGQWARRPGLVYPTDALFVVADSVTLTRDTTQWGVLAPVLRAQRLVYLGVCTHNFPKAVHQVDLVEHMDKAVYLHREDLPGLAQRDAEALESIKAQLTAVN